MTSPDGRVVGRDSQRILVLGVSGMLGHVVSNRLARTRKENVWGTVRTAPAELEKACGLTSERIVKDIDVRRTSDLERVLSEIAPDVVVNCIGVVKQRSDASDTAIQIEVNALFPHHLVTRVSRYGGRVVHVSTDCVFSGSGGPYSEEDHPDPVDVYGRSKLLGELCYPGAVTLRTSIVGPEIDTRQGLLEWYLGEQGIVSGYAGAIFSGVPTVELARIIDEYVLPDSKLSGVYHVASRPIDKASLLELFKDAYEGAPEVRPVAEPQLNRALIMDRFTTETGYEPPEWPDLVAGMKGADRR